MRFHSVGAVSSTERKHICFADSRLSSAETTVDQFLMPVSAEKVRVSTMVEVSFSMISIHR